MCFKQWTRAINRRDEAEIEIVERINLLKKDEGGKKWLIINHRLERELFHAVELHNHGMETQV